jgi:hypothetical protein
MCVSDKFKQCEALAPQAVGENQLTHTRCRSRERNKCEHYVKQELESKGQKERGNLEDNAMKRQERTKQKKEVCASRQGYGERTTISRGLSLATNE